MTFVTPQKHINTTPGEHRLEETVEVLKYCLIAVVMLGTLVAVNTIWTGPVQSHIAAQVASAGDRP